MRCNFYFNVLVEGFDKQKAKEILDERVDRIKEDRFIKKSSLKLVKKPLSYYAGSSKNKKILEKEEKAKKKKTPEQLQKIFVYRKDYEISLEFDNYLDYINTVIRYNPDYSEFIEPLDFHFTIDEMNNFMGVILDGHRKLVMENSVMFGIIQKKCPEVLTKEFREKNKLKSKPNHNKTYKE